MPKILVVDDEYRIRQIIRKYAEFEGYEVEEAVDGMQAIEVCRNNTFDLIIMDVTRDTQVPRHTHHHALCKRRGIR